jgi:4-aminobutyrate aminotransferase
MTALRAPSPGEAWLARDARVLAGVLPRATDVVAASGSGSWLTDVDGRRWLDLTSGIAVTNVGHCHPRVVEAIERQARALVHTSVVAHLPVVILLAERLASLTPFISEPRVFFCNSGAEAVDGALKLARYVTRKPGVVAFRGAFHGRTLAATSLTTAKARYRDGYEPLLPGVHIAPYAYPLHGWGAAEALAALDEVLEGADRVGAMLVEPVLGEGGYVVPPVEWLQGLRERCDAHGILLVFDEVQCGVGRTGRFWASETFGVAPDVLLFAKGIASGLPLGGIVASRALMDAWPTGAHGSTFGGNPVSCAAASATLDVIDDGVLGRVRGLGVQALGRLRAAATPAVAEVRGVGFMIGVEFGDRAVCARAQQRCLDGGVLVLRCGPEGNVLRLIPPLTISEDDLAQGLDVVARAMAASA